MAERGPQSVWLYCGWKATKPDENLAEAIRSLTPEEQESVRMFIDFLKRRDSVPSSPFLAAVDEFVDQHPELLRRLAGDLLPGC
jgi:hypothetical protein